MADQDAGRITVRSARTCHAGWNLVREYEVESAHDRNRQRREVVHRPDLAVVLPYSAQRRTATLVSQVRLAAHLAGFDAPLLEAPSGRIEPDEAPDAAALRELGEETGLHASAATAVARIFLHPALTTEQAHLYLCDLDLCLERRTAPDASDMLGAGRVVEIALHAIAQAEAAGPVVDGKTALLIALLELRRPELFTKVDP